jgi:hypothetical protein
MAVDTNNKQQTTINYKRPRKTRWRRRRRHEDNGGDDGRRYDGADSGDDDDCSGSGDGGGDGCGSLVEEGRGGVCRDDVSGVVRWWSPENRKVEIDVAGVVAIWRFHPTARRHVFDAVLKHGWPSAPCHGATMAEKK